MKSLPLLCIAFDLACLDREYILMLTGIRAFLRAQLLSAMGYQSSLNIVLEQFTWSFPQPFR